MKKILKIIFGLLLVVVIVIIGAVLFINTTKPDIALKSKFNVAPTDSLIERGKYLANNVMVCMDCHSTRDWTKFAGPVVPGTEGKGGDTFPEEAGFPGTYYAKNITPAAIGDWSDAELYRAITSGVTRENEPMFPIMPYLSYGAMDMNDAEALIAYIRSIEPIENKVPDSEPSFPFSIFIRLIAKEAEPETKPSINDVVKYGKYLTTIAACADCHTPQVKGTPIEGMDYAGGFEFLLPTGFKITSANITPDEEFGIGEWTKEDFIDRFKSYTDSDSHKVTPGSYNTIMPWTMYSGMTEDDLGAIYSYLRTITPVKNKVLTFNGN